MSSKLERDDVLWDARSLVRALVLSDSAAVARAAESSDATALVAEVREKVGVNLRDIEWPLWNDIELNVLSTEPVQVRFKVPLFAYASSISQWALDCNAVAIGTYGPNRSPVFGLVVLGLVRDDFRALPQHFDPPVIPYVPDPDAVVEDEGFHTMPERWRPPIWDVVHRLVRGEYDFLYHQETGYGGELPEFFVDTIVDRIRSHPSSFVDIPDEEWSNAFLPEEPPHDGDLMGTSACFEIALWDEDGRTDVTLDGEILDNGEGLRVQVLNIGVF